MSSVGGFREGEIDGKPFHIYTFSSQADLPNSSSSSSSWNLPPPQTLFFCPSLRLQIEKAIRKKNGIHSEDDVLPFNISPDFRRVRSHNQDFCKLPVAPLFWCNYKKPNVNGFFCHACGTSELGTSYYLCVTCDRKFHKECVESPLEIKHISYPFLSLQLYSPSSSLLKGTRTCICCQHYISNMFYYCPANNVNMNLFCALKPIPIVIDHPKRHSHPLTIFPKQASLQCDVCGLIKQLIPTYVCVRCVFVVHQDCIYFPYVIRISRHHHRISFTSYLPPGKWPCGVCRRTVDSGCGGYSCNKCGDYFVHSRCALRRDLWDGKELEGIPEEPEIVVEPFEIVADGIILHFSHGHPLKLEISRVYDDDKFCQACILPIYEGGFYSCVDQCDFILHQACANSPLKKHHPLHAHPLMLKGVTNGYGNRGFFNCDACRRDSGGFVYEDPTSDWDFKLDLRCASVSEPFKYGGHEHPLFLALMPEEENKAICRICQDTGDTYHHRRKLNCIECNFVICFTCATIPYKARYKHDKHFLTFREGREASDQSFWCEVCERKIVFSRRGGFYACDDYCCTTLHDHCMLGTDPYMKPGQTIDINHAKILILHNNTMSRPFCHGRTCDNDRCLYRVVFKKKNMSFCSYHCLN